MKRDKGNNKIKGKNTNDLEKCEKFNAEDTTKYGEFVSTYFAWLSPEEQKKKTEELNNMTKK